jgi:hypothetical protein
MAIRPMIIMVCILHLRGRILHLQFRMQFRFPNSSLFDLYIYIVVIFYTLGMEYLFPEPFSAAKRSPAGPAVAHRFFIFSQQKEIVAIAASC